MTPTVAQLELLAGIASGRVIDPTVDAAALMACRRNGWLDAQRDLTEAALPILGVHLSDEAAARHFGLTHDDFDDLACTERLKRALIPSLAVFQSLRPQYGVRR